jgi:hypothetical protein
MTVALRKRKKRVVARRLPVTYHHNVIYGVTTVFAPSTGATVTNPGATYFGLPVVGFAVTSYTNGFVPIGCGPGTCVLSNYGGNWVHKYTDNIKTP